MTSRWGDGMSEPSATEILAMIEPVCARALAEGRWHDAIVPAMLAYSVLHETAGPDQILELAPLAIVQSAIKGMHSDIEKAD
jgi:hypothetical protein